MDTVLLKDIVLLILGGVIGLVASFVTWLITFKSMVPKIKFAEKISKQQTADNPSGFMYEIRFQNVGRRDIVDISIYGLARVKGLDKNDKELRHVIKLSVGVNNHIEIAACRKTKKIILCKNKKKVEENLGITQDSIRVFDSDQLPNSIFGDDINNKVKEKILILEDILSIGKEAELQFIILGTDRYSGARKYIESPKYKIDDIVEGIYELSGLGIIRRMK